MRRAWFVAITAAVLIVAAVLVGTALVREREYQGLLSRGNASLAAGQTYQAIEAFSGAIALRGDSMVSYLRRGEAYHQRGESGAALRDLRTAARLDPAAPRPQELLGDVNYDLGRYARAVEAYRAFVAIDDRSPRVLYKLGLSLYLSGDIQAAPASLRQAIAQDADLVEAHYVLGLSLRDAGQTRQAIDAFQDAVRLNSSFVPAREELAGIHAAAGRTRQAVEQLEAIAALEPDRPERQTAVAMAYARSGRTDSAVNVLGRAAERYPDNTAVFLALGRIWLEAAEPRRDRMALRKAAEALEPLARRPGASSEALALYGRVLLVSGELAAAEAVLREATLVLPVRLEALAWHADAAERLGRLAVARESLERWTVLASEAAAGRAAQFERLGDLQVRLGDRAAAVRALRQAVQVAGAPASAWLALIRAQTAIGDTAGAAASAERAASLFPRDAVILALARRLRTTAAAGAPRG